MKVVVMAAVFVTALGVVACDPCAGTPSCHTGAEISYTGEFIDRYSRQSIPGVAVTFVRRGGVETVSDTVRAVSNADGFFVIRVLAYTDGEMTGDLFVTPPPPNPAYTVTNLRLATSRSRGNGGILGRFVVNPYLQLLGELHDGPSGAALDGASVTIVNTDVPRLLQPDSAVVATGGDGRFLWEPKVLRFGTAHLRMIVTHRLYATALVVERDVVPQYLDAPPYFLWVPLTRTLRYVMFSARRGTGEALPGVTAQFVKTSGIAVRSDSVLVNVGADGLFTIDLQPLDTGTVTGTLTITPPPPYAAEVFPGIMLRTNDDYATPYLGSFGYGPAATVSATFVYGDDGTPLPQGTLVRIHRVGGLPVMEIPGDIGLRALDAAGRTTFSVATADTGQVIFQMESWLPAPQKTDTIRGVLVPARRSDVPYDAGTFRMSRP